VPSSVTVPAALWLLGMRLGGLAALGGQRSRFLAALSLEFRVTNKTGCPTERERLGDRQGKRSRRSHAYIDAAWRSRAPSKQREWKQGFVRGS